MVRGVTLVTHKLLVRLALLTAHAARAVFAQAVWVVKAVITLGLVLSYTTTDTQTEMYKDRQTIRQTA